MSSDSAPVISVVLPAFNEQECLAETARRLRDVLYGMGYSYEIVFVDDGSSDGTWSVIQGMSADNPNVRGLRLSRNFGQQAALLAGLKHSRGQAMIIMDADLQHPPEMIPALLRHWREGWRHVYTIRQSNEDSSALNRWTGRAFYWLVNRISKTSIVPGAADFRLLDRRVVDVLVSLPETHVYLKGLVNWIGFRSVGIPYEAGARFAGRSKYNLSGLLHLALDGITSFSIVPLRLATFVGLVMTACGAVYLVIILLAFFVWHTTVPGWTSIQVLLLLVSGIQMMMLGLIGEYLGKTFIESKRRPVYVVEEETTVPANAEGLRESTTPSG